MTDRKSPIYSKWFVNQATVIEVDLSSKQTVSLGKPLRPEMSVIISQSRTCLAYNLRLKSEDEDSKDPTMQHRKKKLEKGAT